MRMVENKQNYFLSNTFFVGKQFLKMLSVFIRMKCNNVNCPEHDIMGVAAKLGLVLDKEKSLTHPSLFSLPLSFIYSPSLSLALSFFLSLSLSLSLSFFPSLSSSLVLSLVVSFYVQPQVCYPYDPVALHFMVVLSLWKVHVLF